MELVNESGFPAERAVLQDRTGRDVLVVLVKATYRIGARGLSIEPDPLPIQRADTFHGEPDRSSPKLESDLAPGKPSTDVVVMGHAHAPGGRARQADVLLSAGPIRRALRVFGERRYSASGRPSAPEPFERIPVVYERAFGGRDESAPDPRHHERAGQNPVGVGFLARKSSARLEDLTVPSVEDATALIEHAGDRPEPAGFGFVGRSWEPRLRFAGTYDEAWARGRAPIPPDDFDDRYHQGAHPRLIAPAPFVGGELLTLSGMGPGGPIRAHVPESPPRARITVGAAREELPMVLDTVVILADDSLLSLVYRGRRPLLGDDLLRVRRVAVGV